MRFKIAALSLAGGLIWGAAVLMVASANAIWPGYGGAFLELLASVYPGYQPGAGIGSVLIAALYGLADGAVAGAVLGAAHNFILDFVLESG